MTPEQLLAAALAQRAQWVDLGDGKRARVRRPSEWDTRGLLQRDDEGKVAGIAADLPEAKRFVVGWDGFKESDLISGGADDPVDFHADLWAVWIEDNRKALALVAQAIIDAVIAHETARLGTEKN